jgi:Flp pilus assembly pilin Flp
MAVKNNSKMLKALAARLFKDERGQSTTEYILILSVVVMVALKFKKTFQAQLDKMLGTLGKDLDSAVDDSGPS